MPQCALEPVNSARVGHPRMVPFTKMFSKGRIEQRGVSGAEFGEEPAGDVVFGIAPPKNHKIVKSQFKFLTTFPKFCECVRMCPNTSRCAGTNPNTSKQVPTVCFLPFLNTGHHVYLGIIVLYQNGNRILYRCKKYVHTSVCVCSIFARLAHSDVRLGLLPFWLPCLLLCEKTPWASTIGALTEVCYPTVPL